MKKRHVVPIVGFLFVLLFSPIFGRAQFDPWKMVQKMGRGINLGNTLEAAKEGNWAAPAQEFYFDDYKDAGMTCVRIPVRWDQHTQVDSPYTVDSTWMARVEQVADWALDRGMVAIINAHHDDWLYENFPQNLPRFESIWRQIAEHFKDKPDNLVFEIINEPYFDLSKEQVDTLNRDILRIIRQTNPTRIVIITGGGKNSYQAPLQIDLPDDPYIMAYFHYYRPFSFTHGDQYTWGTADDRAEIRENFQEVADWSSTNHVPILLGEFGVNKDKDRSSLLAWYQTVVNEAVKHGFAFTVWDVGPGGRKVVYYRQANSWDIPVLNILTGQSVFGDSLPVLPATLQAENFDRGGQRIAYWDTDSVNALVYYRPDEGVEIDTNRTGGGYSVCFDHPGEWTEYTFQVDSAAQYVLTVYGGGTDQAKQIRLRFNWQSPGKEYALPPRQADGTFGSVSDTLHFEKEGNQLRITAVDSDVWVDKVQLTLLSGQNVTENLLLNPGFEKGTQYWNGNNCTLTPISAPVHSGSKALLVSGRKAAWSGPQQAVTDILNKKGPGRYTLSAFARAIGDTGVYGKVTVMLEYGGSKHYVGESTRLDTASWTKISATVSLDWQGTLTQAKFYVETINQYNGDFYVDDASLLLDSVYTAVESPATTIIPKAFTITNYPNPFNPETRILFHLPKAGQVTVTVFDLQGRRIRRLVHRRLIAGAHTVLWNGTNDDGQPVASGCYFAVLKTAEGQKVHKLLLLR
ncbi:MAG: cellulase family glycosylhydrolase [Calditrichaeota bacterium]|nr:cellulase family glycosylhydrolase [Calditrichota bacterium]